MSLDVLVEHEEWREVPALEAHAQKCFDTVMASEIKSVRQGSVAVLLTGDDHIQSLNRDYREIDKPTNVLSFPSDFPSIEGELTPLGDIVLAWETCKREATEKSIPLEHHFSHLLIHGLLHLFGYDHLGEAEAVEMEGHETRLLSKLGVPDPYSD